MDGNLKMQREKLEREGTHGKESFLMVLGLDACVCMWIKGV